MCIRDSTHTHTHTQFLSSYKNFQLKDVNYIRIQVLTPVCFKLFKLELMCLPAWVGFLVNCGINGVWLFLMTNISKVAVFLPFSAYSVNLIGFENSS